MRPVRHLEKPFGVALANLPCDRLSRAYVESFFGKTAGLALLAESGLCDGAGRFPAAVTRHDFWQLCLKNVNASGDEGHGCTPCSLPKATWQMIYSAVNQMDCIADGLRQFAQLIPAATGLAISVGHGVKGVHLNYASSCEPGDPVRFERYLEAVALGFHCVLLWVTGRRIEPVQLRLSALLDDEDGSLLAGLSRTIVRQGRGLTVVYDRRDMTLPLGVRKYQHWSNETKAFEELRMTFPAGDSVCAASPTVEKVRQLIASGTLSLEGAAAAMGMSVATLQRRLREMGTSFRRISKEVRSEKLKSLLATDIDFEDVAEELGLSERRSLWRTCQDWLGVSPSEYRKTQRRQTQRLARAA